MYAREPDLQRTLVTHPAHYGKGHAALIDRHGVIACFHILRQFLFLEIRIIGRLNRIPKAKHFDGDIEETTFQFQRLRCFTILLLVNFPAQFRVLLVPGNAAEVEHPGQSASGIGAATETNYKNTLSVALTLVFILALVMGAGPGIYLINPDRADPETARRVLGMPIVYAWTVFWFLVQATVVVLAYIKLWEAPSSGDP